MQTAQLWDGPARPAHPDTIVIGLGNPILGDDGLGWQAAAAVQAGLPGAGLRLPVEVDTAALGGLSLMERLVGYRQAVIIDAISTRRGPPGSLWVFPLEELPRQAAAHLSAAHDTSLQTAIELGRRLGAELPGRIIIVAVEAEISYDFSETLTPAVAAALPQAAQAVIQTLAGWENSEPSPAVPLETRP